MLQPFVTPALAGPSLSPSESIEAVRQFIESNWHETVRNEVKDDGTLLGLPYPYTIPSRKKFFQEFYYWDTYFTCLGLLDTGHGDLALNNARNLQSQMERYGFIPNGNRTFYLTRSQPPYFAPLVWQISSTLGDDDFARNAVPAIRREYDFWTTQRMTPTGLSRHGHHADRQGLLDFFSEIEFRGGLHGRRPEDCLEEISQLMSECETGWDLNHRFAHRCGDYCPVDLNSTLGIYERFLARFAPENESALWSERAETRIRLLNEFCWDGERGGYFDYDYRQGQSGKIVSAATLQPLWAGLATPEQARLVVEKMLPHLECAFGLASCAPGPRDRVCQWDYPNGWPCLQNLAYRGLASYGYAEEARRIAEKYVRIICRTFETTGDLWEKYNVVDGSVNVANENGYEESASRQLSDSPVDPAHIAPPAMMGWTAGVFLDAVAFLEGRAAPLAHR